MITHLVLWNIQGDKDEAVRVLGERFASMPAQIPQILTLKCGPGLVSEATNRQYALVTTHASEDDLNAYQEHPYHQRIKTEVAPYLTDRACADFESDS